MDRDVTMEEWSERRGIAVFEDGGKMPWANECRRLLEAGKAKETDFFLKPLKGPQPCQLLDFNPERSLMDFWPSEL